MYNYQNPYMGNPYNNYQQQIANIQAQYPQLNNNYGQPAIQQQPNQGLQPQNIFLQPSGSLFAIENVEQLNNVPVQEGAISGVIFANANMLYLKSMQNGKPVLLTYSLTNTEAKQVEAKEVIGEKKEPDNVINQSISLLGENAKKLWEEVDALKTKLTKIYEQLGVSEDGK